MSQKPYHGGALIAWLSVMMSGCVTSAGSSTTKAAGEVAFVNRRAILLHTFSTAEELGGDVHRERGIDGSVLTAIRCKPVPDSHADALAAADQAVLRRIQACLVASAALDIEPEGAAALSVRAIVDITLVDSWFDNAVPGFWKTSTPIDDATYQRRAIEVDDASVGVDTVAVHERELRPYPADRFETLSALIGHIEALFNIHGAREGLTFTSLEGPLAPPQR